MDEQMRMRTAAWYGDRTINITFPRSWHVEVFSPRAGVRLTGEQIEQAFRSPIGQVMIRELCKGKSHPVVIVDDLNRPTPACHVMPALLRQFEDAGISRDKVAIVMAPGAHGAPRPEALKKKVGDEAIRACRLYVHDCHDDTVRVGRTSFGTPVFVNGQVMKSDFLVGIGGCYPNQTAGFGGGSKLALGVLGFRSIAALHYGHQSMGWGTPTDRSNFRRDLDEISTMIGLRSMVSLVVDGEREVVDIFCGDPHAYYPDLLSTVQGAFRAPVPASDIDVVISNAYPNDLSLTFVRMKGIAPLKVAPPGASRVVVAACPEGLGFHGLFPFMNRPAHHGRSILGIRMRAMLANPGAQMSKVRRRLWRQLDAHREVGSNAELSRHPIWMYRPEGTDAVSLPQQIPGMRVTSSWNEIVEEVRREQGGRESLRVALYPCASLQHLG